MCKKSISIAVVVGNEPGRVSNIRIKLENGESKIICDFTGRGCQDSRIVKVSDLTPANNKAVKALENELISLSSKVSKKARIGAKLCPA